jgi:hypothetical protein
MALVIKGSTSGQVTIDVPSEAGTNTITLPASTFTVPESGGDNLPAFSAVSEAGQSVAHNTQTHLTPATEVFDTDNAYSSGTFTVPSGKGGKYFISFATSISNLPQEDIMRLGIKVNDVYPYGGSIVHVYEGYMSHFSHLDASDPRVRTDAILDLSAGDTVKVFGLQNSGSSRSMRDQYFGMFRLSGV